MRGGGASPLRAVMVGTAREAQGVPREVESGGRGSPKPDGWPIALVAQIRVRAPLGVRDCTGGGGWAIALAVGDTR